MIQSPNPTQAQEESSQVEQSKALKPQTDPLIKNFRTSVINGRNWTRRMSPQRLQTFANAIGGRKSKANVPGILNTADTDPKAGKDEEGQTGQDDSPQDTVIKLETDPGSKFDPELFLLQSVYESGRDQVLQRANYLRQTRKRLKASFKENMVAVNEEKRHIQTHGNKSSLLSATLEKSTAQLESAGEGSIINLLALKNRRTSSLKRVTSIEAEYYNTEVGRKFVRGTESERGSLKNLSPIQSGQAQLRFSINLDQLTQANLFVDRNYRLSTVERMSNNPNSGNRNRLTHLKATRSLAKVNFPDQGPNSSQITHKRVATENMNSLQSMSKIGEQGNKTTNRSTSPTSRQGLQDNEMERNLKLKEGPSNNKIVGSKEFDRFGRRLYINNHVKHSSSLSKMRSIPFVHQVLVQRAESIEKQKKSCVDVLEKLELTRKRILAEKSVKSTSPVKLQAKADLEPKFASSGQKPKPSKGYIGDPNGHKQIQVLGHGDSILVEPPTALLAEYPRKRAPLKIKPIQTETANNEGSVFSVGFLDNKLEGTGFPSKQVNYCSMMDLHEGIPQAPDSPSGFRDEQTFSMNTRSPRGFRTGREESAEESPEASEIILPTRQPSQIWDKAELKQALKGKSSATGKVKLPPKKANSSASPNRWNPAPRKQTLVREQLCIENPNNPFLVLETLDVGKHKFPKINVRPKVVVVTPRNDDTGEEGIKTKGPSEKSQVSQKPRLQAAYSSFLTLLKEPIVSDTDSAFEALESQVEEFKQMHYELKYSDLFKHCLQPDSEDMEYANRIYKNSSTEFKRKMITIGAGSRSKFAGQVSWKRGAASYSKE